MDRKKKNELQKTDNNNIFDLMADQFTEEDKAMIKKKVLEEKLKLDVEFARADMINNHSINELNTGVDKMIEIEQNTNQDYKVEVESKTATGSINMTIKKETHSNILKMVFIGGVILIIVLVLIGL